MFNENKELVARDEIEITVIDERNIFEKAFDAIGMFFKGVVAGSSMLGIASVFLGTGFIYAVIQLPISLFKNIFKF